MIQFPLNTLLDEQACHDFLLHILHPNGLVCPHGHLLPPEQAPHDRHRAPIMDERCRRCGAVFNLFTNTLFSKTRYRGSTIVLLLRGIAQGAPTKHLTDELGIDRGHPLSRRHDIQAVVARRANKAGGQGTWESGAIDHRLPGWLAAAAGRSACRSVTTAIVRHSSPSWKPIRAMMRRSTLMNGRPSRLSETGRCYQTVCHTPPQREWARDADGDGVREVHTNTIEGIWTGLRNFLRPFRGVSKWFLDQYSAIFEWAHNLKRVTADFVRAMMIPFTSEPT